MTFNEYQDFAGTTADYPNPGKNLVYPAMGCVGEAGEFSDKVKKHWRNTKSMDASKLTKEEKKEFGKELGDQLWYIAMAARELGFTLEDIVDMNVAKLRDRRERGVIKSVGDNR